MSAVYRRELRAYFTGMTAYVFIAFLLLFAGIYTMAYNLSNAYPNFEYVLQSMSIIFLIAIPILTMRVIAEERRQKTDQLLYSLPLKTTDIVLGKYFALTAVFLLPVCIIAVYPLVFSQYGEVYFPSAYGSLLAFFLMGAALIAVGEFLSSLTENQGVAAGISIAVMLFNYYSVSLAEQVSSSAFGALAALVVIAVLLALLVRALTRSDAIAVGAGAALAVIALGIYFLDGSLLENLLPNIMQSLSLFERFYTFVDGVFDLRSIVFFLSVIAFFLFLTVQSLEKRRYN